MVLVTRRTIIYSWISGGSTLTIRKDRDGAEYSMPSFYIFTIQIFQDLIQ